MRFAKAATLALALVLLTTALSPPAKAADVSFGLFFSDLRPHGSWLVSGQYGRVWQPSVYTQGWNPYYDGHWVYADVGWTWVSDYSWGAIPYHYGTWVFDPEFGWVWVPGYTWAPSWVVFRTSPDYIGWAPCPANFSIGASFGFDLPSSAFIFVSTRDFTRPHIRSCAIPFSRTRSFIGRTRVINTISVHNNIVINRGPDLRSIERASGRRIRALPVERVSRIGPHARFSRADLQADPGRLRRGLRAAEPYSSRQPLPDRTRIDRRETQRPARTFNREPRVDRREPQRPARTFNREPRVDRREPQRPERTQMERQRSSPDRAAPTRTRSPRREPTAREKRQRDERRPRRGD